MRGFLPDVGVNPDVRKRVFNVCPVCRRGWRTRSQIMDLVTKGEAPFSNLVKAQFLAQPARRPESAVAPNGGRKSLLFSDGRQKAARLARDIPREVEQDSFRQALALGCARSTRRRPRAETDERTLYGGSWRSPTGTTWRSSSGTTNVPLLSHCREFHDDYRGRTAAMRRSMTRGTRIRFRGGSARRCSANYAASITHLLPPPSDTLAPPRPAQVFPLFARDIAPLFPQD